MELMIEDQYVRLGGLDYYWHYAGIDSFPTGWHRRAWCPDDCWDWHDANSCSVESGKERKRLRKKFVTEIFPDMLHDLTKSEEMRMACLLRMMGANRKQIRAVEVGPDVSKAKKRIAEFVAIQSLISERMASSLDATQRGASVYVVRLASEAQSAPKVCRDNPGSDRRLGCVYVGMTGLSPKQRLKKHKSGQKASRYVRKYGKKLIPELTAGLHDLQQNDAMKIERKLAELLRRQGYAVTGGH